MEKTKNFLFSRSLGFGLLLLPEMLENCLRVNSDFGFAEKHKKIGSYKKNLDKSWSVKTVT